MDFVKDLLGGAKSAASTASAGVEDGESLVL